MSNCCVFKFLSNCFCLTVFRFCSSNHETERTFYICVWFFFLFLHNISYYKPTSNADAWTIFLKNFQSQFVWKNIFKNPKSCLLHNFSTNLGLRCLKKLAEQFCSSWFFSSKQFSSSNLRKKVLSQSERNECLSSQIRNCFTCDHFSVKLCGQLCMHYYNSQAANKPREENFQPELTNSIDPINVLFDEKLSFCNELCVLLKVFFSFCRIF